MALKFSLGFYMRGTRCCAINEHVVDLFCPRLSETEDCNHVVKCRCTEERRKEHLSKLRGKLEKLDDAAEDSIKIVSDTRKFLNNDTRFETNQDTLSMRNVIRRTSIKSWTYNEFDANEDRKCNKIIVKESVTFHTECWVDRCKVMHDEEEQKKRLSQWCGNALNEMLNGESEARRHVERTRLNIDRAPNEHVRSWMLEALKMKKKLKKHPQNYIRRFFNG